MFSGANCGPPIASTSTHGRIDRPSSRINKSDTATRPGRRGFLLLALTVTAVVLPGAGLGAASAKHRAAGYIVVYRSSVANVGRKTTALQRANGFRSDFRYAHALKGFAAHLSSAQVNRLRGNKDVALV